MIKTASGTIAFVAYLLQNVLPWCSRVALSAVYEVTCVREAHTLRATDKVEIGMTALHVSRLGLGGVALSGAPPATDPHQTTSAAEAVAIIQGSLALGLNYLDTAPLYGVGQSERRYGQALHGRARDSYVLSTKVGRVLHASEPGSAQMTWSFDFSREGVRRSFETSLERLGVDRWHRAGQRGTRDHVRGPSVCRQPPVARLAIA